MGSHRLRYLGVGTFRDPRLLLFGLHRSVVSIGRDERAFASAEAIEVYPKAVGVFEEPVRSSQVSYERVTMSDLGSDRSQGIQRFPTLKYRLT